MNRSRIYQLVFAFLLLQLSPVQAQPQVSPVDSQAGTVQNITISSKMLKKEMKCCIYLPYEYTKTVKYPVLYMIHGWDGNETTLLKWLDFGKHADKLIKSGKIKSLIIVFPEVDNSFGINSSDSCKELNAENQKINIGRYEDYICSELVSFIDSGYSTIASRGSRFIGGISMGGFIALRTSFRHTDLYSKAAGHSPALWSHFPNDQMEKWIYPDEKAREEGDPLLIAKNKDLSGLKVFLDCGDKDNPDFVQGCQQLNATLRNKGVSVQLSVTAGVHDEIYWTGMEDQYLMFYAGYPRR